MFKKLLSLAALALCAGSMNAQIESGSQYYIQNVESGLYLCGQNNWGTRSTVATQGDLFTTNLNDGKYELVDNDLSSGDKALGTNLFTDSTGANWTIEAVEGETGVYTIKNDAGYIAQSATAGYHIGYLTELVANVTDAAKWYFLTVDAAKDKLAAATKDNPIDATFLIGDANFSRNHATTPWTMVSDNQNLCGGNLAGENGASSNGCAESWTHIFTLSQTLSVLNGVYELTAQAALTDYSGAYDGTDYPVVYANDATSPFISMEEGDRGTNMTTLSNSFAAGKYVIEPVKVTVSDGKLTIGVKGTRTNTWCIWDNFQLKYYGLDLTDAREAYEKANAAANAVDATQKMSKTASDGLSNAKSTYGNKTYTTVAAYEKATNELNDAAKAANESITDYATQKAQCVAYESKIAAAGIQDAMEDFSNGFWDCYNAGTLGGELSELIQQYGEQISALWQNAQDFSSKIANASFEKDGVAGWTNTDCGGAANNGNWEGRTGDIFAEKWTGQWNKNTGDGEKLYNGSISQTITLPAGEYYLIVDAKCEQQNGGTAGKGMFAFIGNNTYEVNSATGEECIVYYNNETVGDVTFGIKLEGCTGNWACYDNFRLMYVGDLDTSVLEQLIKDAGDYYDTLDPEKDYAKDLKDAIDQATEDLKTASTLEEVESLTTTLQGYIDAAKLGARKDTYAVITPGKYIIAIQDEEDGTYKFLGAGNNWGTQASLIAHPQYVTITKAEDGKYYVESQVSNGGESKYFNGGWMDGAKTAFEFIGEQMLEGMDYYTVQLSNGTNYYYNNNGLVDNKAEADFGEDGPQLWAVMSVEVYEAMVGSDASEEDPADFTHRILDADLGRNNVNVAAWTITNATNPKTSGDVASANANFSIEAYKAKFNVVQTITDLPEGLYELKATAMYRQDGADPVLPYIFIEDAKADFAERTGTENDMRGAAASMATGLYTVSTRAYVGEDGTINIGAATEGTSCWAIFDNFQLYYLGEMTLTEYNRATAAGKYGTICLPYAAATEDATVYSAAIDGTEVVLTAVEAMEAGKSYIFLANKDNVKFSQVPGGIVDAPVSSLPLVGVCVPTLVPVGDYVLQTQDGVQNFYKVVEGAQPTLGDCKAYLTAPAASGAKVLSFASATAIKALDALVSGDAKIYDLNGRQLKSLQKGVNIVNGVKVMVK